MPVSGSRSPVSSSDAAELRLELTTAEVRQVWALYSQPLRATPTRSRVSHDATEPPLGARLRELGPLAWRARRTLALSSAAALALGALYLLVATPTVGVSASLLVEQRDAGARDASAALDAGAFLAGQAELLSDASLVHEALLRAGIGDVGDEPGPALRPWAWLPLPERSAGEAGRDAVARALAAFSARPVFGTQVIALEYRTQDPASGVRFVQAVIDRYAELARGLDSGEAGVAVRTLAAPTRRGSPLWPRPLPVLFACLLLGLLAGLGLAALAERAEPPEMGWTQIREAAWAG